MCALSALVSIPPVPFKIFLKYYTEARKHILDAIDSPSLQSLQGLLTLSVVSFLFGNIPSGSIQISMAARMMYLLGYDNLSDDGNQGISAEEQDSRNRCFFTCFTVDRMISVASGQPVSFLPDKSSDEVLRSYTTLLMSDSDRFSPRAGTISDTMASERSLQEASEEYKAIPEMIYLIHSRIMSMLYDVTSAEKQYGELIDLSGVEISSDPVKAKHGAARMSMHLEMEARLGDCGMTALEDLLQPPLLRVVDLTRRQISLVFHHCSIYVLSNAASALEAPLAKNTFPGFLLPATAASEKEVARLFDYPTSARLRRDSDVCLESLRNAMETVMFLASRSESFFKDHGLNKPVIWQTLLEMYLTTVTAFRFIFPPSRRAVPTPDGQNWHESVLERGVEGERMNEDETLMELAIPPARLLCSNKNDKDASNQHSTWPEDVLSIFSEIAVLQTCRAKIRKRGKDVSLSRSLVQVQRLLGSLREKYPEDFKPTPPRHVFPLVAEILALGDGEDCYEELWMRLERKEAAVLLRVERVLESVKFNVPVVRPFVGGGF
ncbi:hypothetical protein HDU97_006817 [Phlyctochytrium planicorne]|nr:hypothetical protein HDU97_006817 [Phlyctochytrium planicorne]